MKTFRLTADATFQAENIGDAMRRLADHFEGLIDGLGGESIFDSGTIEVQPDADKEGTK